MADFIDLDTAKSFVESHGYTCVQLDPLLEGNTNSKLFDFNVDSVSSSVSYFMGTLCVFGMFRISQLKKLLHPHSSDSLSKKKNK